MKKKKHSTLIAIGFLIFILCFTSGEAMAYSQQSFHYAIEKYQLTPPQYQYDDAAEAAEPADISPRFTKRGKIYINQQAEESGSAILMITGDLMCQYRQQESVFVSDGSPYLSYQEILARTEKNTADSAPNRQKAASDYGKIPQPTGTWDFKESFRYVKPILSRADLVIGNLETMLSQSSPLGMQLHTLEGKPYLNGPVSYLEALDYAGYDLFTMANNHCCDTGVQGIFETIDNVDKYGFMHTGLFTNKKDPRYLIVNVNGIKIGIVSYAAYFNKKDSNLTKTGQAVMLNRYDGTTAKNDIRAVKKAGAQFVLAFIHCGNENTNKTNAKQKRIANALAEAGADYVIGSHPHALQSYKILKTSDGREVPVIYSMGNFLSHMRRDINNDTIILQLKLKERKGKVSIVSQRYYPCKVYENLEEHHYVILPCRTRYQYPFLNETEDAQMKEAFRRITNIYKNRIILPLPYYSEKKKRQADFNCHYNSMLHYINEDINEASFY